MGGREGEERKTKTERQREKQEHIINYRHYVYDNHETIFSRNNYYGSYDNNKKKKT